MSTTTVKCGYCGNSVKKPTKEYNRRLRLGKNKFYCNQSCAAKTKENVDRLKSIETTNDISKYCENRKDKYSPFRPIMKLVRQREDKKGKTNLTLEYLKELWESQNGKCPFTNWDLDLRTYKTKDGKLRTSSASLDRINNSLGYIKGNVRFVSVIFNFARNKFTDEEVIEFCKAVAKENDAKPSQR